ncbi:hypothetical protein SVAN01_00027 [Stagonosporopsis vannaccii]|nr:hypothetical protein SVAN01_00027 [Stagonosporopsis vannaccii]
MTSTIILKLASAARARSEPSSAIMAQNGRVPAFQHGLVIPRAWAHPQGQVQAPVETWEQAPTGNMLMNGILDAVMFDSDFEFWTMPLNVNFAESDAPLHVQQPLLPERAQEQNVEQANWEDLESYTGSSDDEQGLRDHAYQAMSEQYLSLEDLQHESQSALTDSSVHTYSEEDLEWWHGMLSGLRFPRHWDGIHVMVFLVFIVFVCFLGGVAIWVLVTT